nr:40S ribosomal protein S6 [Cryptomonas sp.]
MKINISNPKNGCQKTVVIENEHDLRVFYDKSITSEVNATALGPEWEGYILKINGGQDKQGFPMKPGVITNRRVRLLLSKGTIGCKGYTMKKGERKRKSVRGCIVSPEIGLLNLSIVKEGNEIPGLTSLAQQRIFGPKRSSKIRKTFILSKGDDLRKYTIKKLNQKLMGNGLSKHPKIQRLVTPIWLQRKRFKIQKKKNHLIKTKMQLSDYGRKIELEKRS